MYPFSKNYSRRSSQKGFTLIELLIVIAIIGILSSIVLVSTRYAMSRARDAQRKNDLHAVATGLEMYFNDFGTYKVEGAGWTPPNHDQEDASGMGYIDAIGGQYIQSITAALFEKGYMTRESLLGPNASVNYMIYLCDKVGNAYNSFALSATLENPSQADIDHIKTTCNGTGSNGTYDAYHKNYAVSNVK